ncbi:MAG: multidrug efflux SMR transporter [Pseudomonadota bacterium]|nr:multidrug efflux SMR transporter [Pseudomonadota bacterium]
MSPWIYLGIAIALEIAGTFFLKLSNGFERWQWGLTSMACYSACFWALAPAMKLLPVGIVYAIWSGVGIVAASLIGIFAFEEKLGALQFFFIAMILTGAVGLNLTVTQSS